MHSVLPKSIVNLATHSPAPLYAVGGIVRDFLLGFSCATPDFDICAPMSADTFVSLAETHGFTVNSVYKNTGTVKLQDENGVHFEFASFRSDKYVRGIHAPIETVFTTDITADAKRRDFTANAVYYDIKKQCFVDPLNGIAAIKEKRLTTVTDAKKVFSEDGLRLMRLARFAGQLGFFPDTECMQGATANAALIQDVVPERIFTELCAILLADTRFGVADGHYQGLRILNQARVLDYILPELTLGRDMAQRADFHNYDVLEHSLRATLYAPPSIRLAALLHDVGKPTCTLRDGNAHAHPQEGAIVATHILQRLKAPKKTVERVSKLVEMHMYDFNCQTKENKLRKFFILNAPYLQELLLLKQADFSACKDDTSIAPTCVRWQTLLHKMREENVPFSLRDLAVSGKDLLDIHLPPHTISQTLQSLLLHVAIHPKDNHKSTLLKLARHQ